MGPIEDRLTELIDASGIVIIETSKLGRHLNAAYHPSGKIFVRWGLDAVTRRCSIAHELGHAHYGHNCSTPGAERAADEWAALRLIALDDVETAAKNCDGAASAIAAEIGITPHLLTVWMRLHETGRITQERNCAKH